jgi:hypothetical protein
LAWESLSPTGFRQKRWNSQSGRNSSLLCPLKPQPPEIELQRQIVVARLRLKDTIVNDVCLDRLSLLEAAARFRDLDQLLPVQCTDEFRLRHQPSSDEECYCLKVVVAAEAQLRASRQPASPLGARLRAELNDRLAAGTLRFPDAALSQN